MSEHLPDVDKLPDVQLSTADQIYRASQLVRLIGNQRLGPAGAACLIVHLQDQLAKPAHERESPHCSTCSCGMPAAAPGEAQSVAWMRRVTEGTTSTTAPACDYCKSATCVGGCGWHNCPYKRAPETTEGGPK